MALQLAPEGFDAACALVMQPTSHRPAHIASHSTTPTNPCDRRPQILKPAEKKQKAVYGGY
jgi:hypothetical protein